jgi:hypothetical protein
MCHPFKMVTLFVLFTELLVYLAVAGMDEKRAVNDQGQEGAGG